MTKIHLIITNAAGLLTCYQLSCLVQVVRLSVMLERRQGCGDSDCWTGHYEQRRRVLRRWDRWGCALCQKTLASADIGVSSPALTHQGWSQMIPVRSVLRMPWCRLTAAPRRRMECGSAGKGSCTRVCMHAFFLQIIWSKLEPYITCVMLDFVASAEHLNLLMWLVYINSVSVYCALSWQAIFNINARCQQTNLCKGWLWDII